MKAYRIPDSHLLHPGEFYAGSAPYWVEGNRYRRGYHYIRAVGIGPSNRRFFPSAQALAEALAECGLAVDRDANVVIAVG